MLRFTPKSQNEIDQERILPEGIYSFEVTTAVQAQSKTGNDMIKLFLNVYKPDGTVVPVVDFLVLTDTMIYKLLHFCQAVGREELYNSGSIQPDGMGNIQEFIGCQGQVKLGIQKSADYPDKNNVKDYVKSEGTKTVAAKPKKQPPPKDDEFSDDIPF
jgi:hypothetical protein